MSATTSKAGQLTALFRLTVRNPAPGATYSLQGKDGVVVDPRQATGQSLVFAIPVRIGDHAAGPRVLGDFVRTEGKTRRFIYLATGRQAGETKSSQARRAKIDFPNITPTLCVLAAKRGLVMEAGLEGTARDGGPIAATVELSPDWTLAKA